MVCACLFPSPVMSPAAEGSSPTLAEVTEDRRDAVLNIRLPRAYIRSMLADATANASASADAAVTAAADNNG